MPRKNEKNGDRFFVNVAVFTLLLFSMVSVASEKKLYLYHDADWSNYTAASESIWRGVNVALQEVDYTVQGYRIEVVKKNHSGNVLRSLNNVKAFVDDKHALAVISGMHSQPLIKNRDFINENDVLTLVPWAAGGPVTRYPSSENWIFRLSVDDTKAGGVLVDYALDQKGCKSPHMLLAGNPWGDSNLYSMGKALTSRGKDATAVTRFNWNLKRYSAISKASDIVASGADCVLLVANVIEGIEIVKAFASLEVDKRLPIISHWGITGGDFHLQTNAEERKAVDLTFIQTCFSFMDSPLSAKGKEVLTKATVQYPDVRSPSDIASPVGFIHGYDITRLMLSALNEITLHGDAKLHRDELRLALENIDGPVEGLVKTYSKPYGQYSDSQVDAHEALSSPEYCMASYDANDDILLDSK
jgi:branched-chain amino acid transport system substrate-binding protein